VTSSIPVNKVVNEKEQLEKGLEEREEKHHNIGPFINMNSFFLLNKN
jgi:hypothetical protein